MGRLLELLSRKGRTGEIPVLFDPEAMPDSLLKTKGMVYLVAEFRVSGKLVHTAILTANDLQYGFSGSDAAVTIVGYMSEEEALAMTLEERGMTPMPPMKPENVPAHVWEKLDHDGRVWLIEHERKHDELRRNVAAVKAVLNSAHDAL